MTRAVVGLDDGRAQIQPIAQITTGGEQHQMAEAGEPVLEVAARYQGQRQKGSAPVFLLKFRDMQALPASQALPVNAVQAVDKYYVLEMARGLARYRLPD